MWLTDMLAWAPVLFCYAALTATALVSSVPIARLLVRHRRHQHVVGARTAPPPPPPSLEERRFLASLARLVSRMTGVFRGRGAAPAATVTDVVVLIPGYLGIEHLVGYHYFGGAVLQALRDELAAHRPGRAATTRFERIHIPPTLGLDRRQAALVQRLEDLRDKYGRDVEVHLVGHSTGGVDALLLLAPHRLQQRARWSNAPLAYATELGPAVDDGVNISTVVTVRRARARRGACLRRHDLASHMAPLHTYSSASLPSLLLARVAAARYVHCRHPAADGLA